MPLEPPPGLRPHGLCPAGLSPPGSSESGTAVVSQLSRPSNATTVTTMMAVQVSDSLTSLQMFENSIKVPQKSCRMTFKSTLLLAIIASTAISCMGMLVALEFYRLELRHVAGERIKASVTVQHDLVSELINCNVTGAAFSRALETVRQTIQTQVHDELDAEVGGIWVFMHNQQRLFQDWDGRAERNRSVIANFSYVQLRQHLRRTHNNPHTKMIKVSWSSGEEVGCSLTKESGTDAHRIWAYDMAGSSARTVWAVDWETGMRIEPPDSTKVHEMGKHPAYLVQQEAAAEARLKGDGAELVPSKRLWSRLFHSRIDGRLGVSLTAPISYCGDYSCFDGVVEAFVSLEYISFYCDQEWGRLRRLLEGPMYDTKIGLDNSSVFIVKHTCWNKTQEGMLVGASGSMLTQQTFADMYMARHSGIVNATATALLRNFSRWDAPGLINQEQLFTFRYRDGEVSHIGDCDPETEKQRGPEHASDCMQVGTRSVQLDSRTRWLVVVVLPMGAFSLPGEKAADDVRQQVRAIEVDLEAEMSEARVVGLLVFGSAMAICITVALCLSFLVSRRLSFLADLIRRLGDLDFARDSQEFTQLRLGTRSRILEVGNLQDSFCRLSRGIEAFARFVPETVVQNIVRGDPYARHLHVSRRVVTIMFSDIREFTSISEKVTERDLLYLLTRYFSAMTHVIERYEGVLAELLGDGLLVYWNAPGDVEEHAEKACRASVAQQEEVAKLNRAFADECLCFPELYVRIGLHTGPVLSGNIGSETKMKFGCIGDPVNTASRLEGLCKVYGVPIVCSAVTVRSLPDMSSVMCRRLDTVQVKGKQSSLGIHEVQCDVELQPGVDLEALAHRKQQYEEALDHFQQARFREASNVLGALLADDPCDAPAARLRDQAEHNDGKCADLKQWSCVSLMTEK